MLWIRANDAHHAVAVNHLALVTQFLYRCPNFHGIYPFVNTAKLVHASGRAPKAQCAPGHPLVNAQNSPAENSPNEPPLHALLQAVHEPARWATTPSQCPRHVRSAPATASSMLALPLKALRTPLRRRNAKAWTTPRDHCRSRRPYAQNAPNKTHLLPQPSICRTKLLFPPCLRSPSAQSPAPCQA